MILGREDPLEEKMATHSSTLARKIPRAGAWRATVLGTALSTQKQPEMGQMLICS